METDSPVTCALVTYQFSATIVSICSIFTTIYYYTIINPISQWTDFTNNIFILAVFILKSIFAFFQLWGHFLNDFPIRLCQNNKTHCMYRTAAFMASKNPNCIKNNYVTLVLICNICIPGVIFLDIMLLREIFIANPASDDFFYILVSETIFIGYLVEILCYRLYKGLKFFDVYAIVNGSANYIQDGSEIVPLNANAIDIDDIDYPADNNYDESVIQPKTYSKRTLSMWVYWHMGLITILFCLMGSVLIYAMDNKVLTNDSDDIIYQIYFKLFMTKWIANSVFSFTFFYPTRYCKYINPLQPSIPLPHVSICSFGMFIIISVEIYFFIYFFGINPVSYDINYLNVIICEFGAIFGWCYIIIYRFVSKRENLNFAFVGDEQTEKTSLYTLYREKLYPDKYHKNCCWKVVYYLYQSAV
eukprot:17291_1